ncbi:MAG: hypothetical protein RJA22_539 [Verrucomicrobiota bacterium]|jgi:hypothetical protein
MARPQQPLHRLLAAAARATPAPVGPMPAALQTRILARCRHGAGELAGAGLVLLFRRALVGAALLMALTVAWTVVTEEPDDEVTLANYTLRADLNP